MTPMGEILKGIAGDLRVFRNRYHTSTFQFLVHPSHPALWLLRTAAGGPRVLALIARHLLLMTYGCDVQYGAQLVPGLLIPHPLGIVIGSGCVVETDVMIFQHVTLGAGSGGFPVVREGATLFTGCTVIGSIEVGRNARVGAATIVKVSVSPGETVK